MAIPPKPNPDQFSPDFRFDESVRRQKAIEALENIKRKLEERDEKVVAVRVDNNTTFYTTPGREKQLRDRLKAINDRQKY